MINENQNSKPLVRIDHLKKYFTIKRKSLLHAVDDVSFDIYPGDTFGLVGESGCGKSTVGNVIMRLLKKTDGTIWYRDKDIFSINKEESFELRKKMQIIFQDPYSSLNPRKTVKEILGEIYVIHKIGDKKEIQKKIYELCDLIQITYDTLDRFPHELDGGMRQVIGIARALSFNADFIVCDEPVSSLDVSIQARIINLLMNLREKLGLTYLFISHDLSVVRHISNRIAVMYLGQIVEIADTEEMFRQPTHPYTIALLSAVPKVDVDRKIDRIVLKGDVPSPINPKPGCRFAPRCWMASENCKDQDQFLKEVSHGHFVSCMYANSSQNKLEKSKLNNNQLKSMSMRSM